MLPGCRHVRLHQAWPITDKAYGVAIRFEKTPVGRPARGEGLLRVVKEIDVTRQAGGRDELVQGDTARDVAFARRDSVLG
jgi:hypothetical protein